MKAAMTLLRVTGLNDYTVTNCNDQNENTTQPPEIPEALSRGFTLHPIHQEP
jgi:hypothetical protein